jgi:hypothetical protein
MTDRAMSDLSPRDLAALAFAKEALERPSLAIRIADRLGAPVDALVRRLPDPARRLVSDGTQRALHAALDVALRTLDDAVHRPAADWVHRGLVVATGAIGGAAGLAGLLVELPLSTAVMLRSIADHARAEGEDLSLVATRLECLAVFAYGSAASSADDAAESAYFAARAALGRAVAQAAEYVAERGAATAVGERAAPALVELVTRIAQRFGVAVADKAAAQLVPVLGAAGGAAINALFIDHYQATARAHFSVRRLVRTYGEEEVRRAYVGV